MTDCPEPEWFLNRLRAYTATVKSVGGGCNKYTSAQSYGMKRKWFIQQEKPVTEHMKRGVRMEQPILDRFCAARRLHYIESPLIMSTKAPRQGATADGLGYDDRTGRLYTLEAKCPMVLPRTPPLHYVIQIIQQLHVWNEALELFPDDERPVLDSGFLICMTEELDDSVCWEVTYSAAFDQWISRRQAIATAYTERGLMIPARVNRFAAHEYQAEFDRMLHGDERPLTHPLYMPKVRVVPYHLTA